MYKCSKFTIIVIYMSAGCSSQRRSGSSNKENEVPQLCVSPTILCACETQAKKQEYVLVLYVSPLLTLNNTLVTSNFLNAVKSVDYSLFPNDHCSNWVIIRYNNTNFSPEALVPTTRYGHYLRHAHMAATAGRIWSWYVCFGTEIGTVC